jgi:hypothetical protein
LAPGLAERGFDVSVGHVLARRQRAAHVVTEHLGDDSLGMRSLRRHQRLPLSTVSPKREPASTGSHRRPCGAHCGTGVAAKSRAAWHGDEWFVAVRRRSTDGRVHGAVRVVPKPRGPRYLADRFPIEVAGRHFIFVEDYSQAARRGVISSSKSGRTTRARRRLRVGTHRVSRTPGRPAAAVWVKLC